MTAMRKNRDEPAPRRAFLLRVILPAGLFAVSLLVWDLIVRLNHIPPYILPGPGKVIATLFADRDVLAPALANTLLLTLTGLGAAVVGGVGLAVLLSRSRIAEYTLLPYAVIFQVTPIVAVFPLINIYIDSITAKLLLCTWIVAFFPVLSNTIAGLRATERNLKDLMRLYGASPAQTLLHLELPAALPYFLAGLRIAGGLALIGSVVAEFVAGSAGAGTGLATRIVEAGFRLDMPRLFACLILISLSGIALYALTSLVSHLALRKWHESALGADI